jgi:hypothetical protein
VCHLGDDAGNYSIDSSSSTTVQPMSLKASKALVGFSLVTAVTMRSAVY